MNKVICILISLVLMGCSEPPPKSLTSFNVEALGRVDFVDCYLIKYQGQKYLLFNRSQGLCVIKHEEK